MLNILDSQEYVEKIMALPRPGEEQVLAFYEHRLGAACRDPRLMLLPLDEHLVHRGDGVFEALKYVGGRLYQLDPHLERMRRSAGAISLEPPCSWEELRQIVIDLARAGGEPDGIIRIYLGRGPGGFGVDPLECPEPGLYLSACRFEPAPEAMFEKGKTAYRTNIPAKQPWLAQIKSIDYLPNVLMKREAIEKGADFPICFDADGHLAEGAVENVCLVKDGVLVAPKLKNVLRGTTLMRGIEMIKDEIPTVFHDIGEQEIYEAGEMIVLGTSYDAVSIVRYNGAVIGAGEPGPVSRRLRELLREDLARNGTPF